MKAWGLVLLAFATFSLFSADSAFAQGRRQAMTPGGAVEQGWGGGNRYYNDRGGHYDRRYYDGYSGYYQEDPSRYVRRPQLVQMSCYIRVHNILICNIPVGLRASSEPCHCYDRWNRYYESWTVPTFRVGY